MGIKKYEGVFTYLTPLIPLSKLGVAQPLRIDMFGEGEKREEGLAPLLNTPLFYVGITTG
jgi:hypothetical protein